MKCMKCGREQDSEQVFCNDCLAEMEKYPVSPNATVHLPLHRDVSHTRKPQPRRPRLSPEEQIKVLKKRLWFLSGILIVSLVLIAMIQPTAEYFIRRYNLRPGQNYSTITPTTTAPTEVTETVDPFEGMAE